MTAKAASLRRAVFFMVLMALAMISRPALASEGPTYHLGWKNGSTDTSNHIMDGENQAGILSGYIELVIGGSVNPIPMSGAISGRLVSVKAFPEDGYTLKHLYFEIGTEQKDIEFDPLIDATSEAYGGTFVMPEGDTLIGGEFEKKTYTVSVDFGSNHAGFVQQYFAGKDGIVVDGSIVKLTVTHGETSPSDVASTLSSILNNSSANFVDNNECLMTDMWGLTLGKYPRAQYGDQDAYEALKEPYYNKGITQDMSLCALWAQPVGNFILTLRPCKCGDVLEYKGHWSQVGWEPDPYLGVEGNVHLYKDNDIIFSDWSMSTEDGNPLTLQGGTSYPAHVLIAPDWGYFIPDDFAGSMTVENGEYVSSDNRGSYRELEVKIPVKHIVPEGTEELAPTCTEGDTRTYHCTGCDQDITETADALGHDWDEPTYTWANDNSTCSATHTCKREGCGKEESETAITTSIATATCTEGGTTTYTATFSNEAFQTQTKNVEFAALGHDWGDWAQIKAPTCEAKGSEKRSCKREGCTESQTRDVNPLGHDWGDATYTWADDNSTCKATRTCKRDSSHVQTETVKTSSAVTKEPTATETGTRTYTATFKNEAFKTQTKTESIPKEEAGVTYSIEKGANATWTKGSNASVTITVKRSTDDDTTFSHFTGILMDNKEVDEDQYKAESGSVVVTLPASYLETLSVGEHSFTALFDDGSASTKLTVKSASQAAQKPGTTTSSQSSPARGTTATPATADRSDTDIAATLAVLSLPLLLVARRLRRTER